jgi:hypothetical protein
MLRLKKLNNFQLKGNGTMDKKTSVYETIHNCLLISTYISTSILYSEVKHKGKFTSSLETFAKTFRDYRRLNPEKVEWMYRDNTSNNGKHKVFKRGEG